MDVCLFIGFCLIRKKRKAPFPHSWSLSKETYFYLCLTPTPTYLKAKYIPNFGDQINGIRPHTKSVVYVHTHQPQWSEYRVKNPRQDMLLFTVLASEMGSNSHSDECNGKKKSGGANPQEGFNRKNLISRERQ